MINYKEIFSIKPFSIKKNIKTKWFLNHQKKLTIFHLKNCVPYKKLTQSLFRDLKKTKNLLDLPYVHSGIFKNYNLTSANKNQSTKTFTSSGTSKSNLSKINIDRKTSLLQSRALEIILNNFLKKKIKTIFFVDTQKSISGSDSLTARGAAIRGFSRQANNSFFLMDKDYNLRIDKLVNFIDKNPNEPFIIFGFTSFVWLHLVKKLIQKKIKLKKNKGIIIHGGGWKKMKDDSIPKELFYNRIREYIGVKKIHNYYGMIEQTGSIFLECENGFLHSSIFSEILIRDKNLELCKTKKVGLIQVFSLLPISYPGHNILTEDIGVIEGEDNCKCGRLGKYFSVVGRVKGTELRGCSDVH